MERENEQWSVYFGSLRLCMQHHSLSLTLGNPAQGTTYTGEPSLLPAQDARLVADMTTDLQQISPEQLAECRGEGGKPLWLSICGNVYDVSSGKDFYGPDCNGNLEGATEKQLKTLADWEKKLSAKYPCVGKLTVPQ